MGAWIPSGAGREPRNFRFRDQESAPPRTVRYAAGFAHGLLFGALLVVALRVAAALLGIGG